MRLATPMAVELSTCIGERGCGHPISSRVSCSGTIAFAHRKSAASLCYGGHYHFDYPYDGQDGSINTWYRVVLGKHNMCCHLALGLACIEVPRIRLGGQDHVASPEGDSIDGVGGNVVD